mgnify:CR=1 FL=1
MKKKFTDIIHSLDICNKFTNPSIRKQHRKLNSYIFSKPNEAKRKTEKLQETREEIKMRCREKKGAINDQSLTLECAGEVWKCHGSGWRRTTTTTKHHQSIRDILLKFSFHLFSGKCPCPYYPSSNHARLKELLLTLSETTSRTAPKACIHFRMGSTLDKVIVSVHFGSSPTWIG